MMSSLSPTSPSSRPSRSPRHHHDPEAASSPRRPVPPRTPAAGSFTRSSLPFRLRAACNRAISRPIFCCRRLGGKAKLEDPAEVGPAARRFGPLAVIICVGLLVCGVTLVALQPPEALSGAFASASHALTSSRGMASAREYLRAQGLDLGELEHQQQAEMLEALNVWNERGASCDRESLSLDFPSCDAAVPDLLTPVAHTSPAPASANATIFVAIATFRDPYCALTLASLFHQADFPERLVVGIAQQNLEGDVDCVEEWLKYHGALHKRFLPQVRIMRTDARDSKGPAWARWLTGTLYNNEDYFMQLDSHIACIHSWDTRLIMQQQRASELAPSGRAVLSHYTNSLLSEDVPVKNLSFVVPPDQKLFLLQAFGVPVPLSLVDKVAREYPADRSFARFVPKVIYPKTLNLTVKHAYFNDSPAAVREVQEKARLARIAVELRALQRGHHPSAEERAALAAQELRAAVPAVYGTPALDSPPPTYFYSLYPQHYIQVIRDYEHPKGAHCSWGKKVEKESRGHKRRLALERKRDPAHEPPVQTHVHTYAICHGEWEDRYQKDPYGVMQLKGGIIHYNCPNGTHPFDGGCDLTFGPGAPDPSPAGFIGGGFVFGPGSAMREVPYDPDLSWVFWGEEPLQAARYWTHGFDVYFPSESVCWHVYGRPSMPRKGDYPVLDSRRGRERVARMLGLYPSQANLSFPKMERQEADSVARYGPGKKRSVQDWHKYVGFNITASPRTFVKYKFCR